MTPTRKIPDIESCNTARSSDRAVPADRSGSALLVVLIMLGAIALLAFVMARSVSNAAIETSTLQDLAVSEANLPAGIEIGVAAILQLGDTMRSADAAAELRHRRITVHITNERARIDLNQAPKPILTALFAAHGAGDDEAEALAAAVSDWRGGSASQKLVPPRQVQVFGTQVPGLTTFDASEEDSKAAPNQSIGIRYFFHPMQLLSVPGFSISLLRSIIPLVTVANGSSRIDPFIAPRGVLEALPGTTPGQVQGFVDSRDDSDSRDMSLLLLGADKTFISDTAAPGWRLEITSASSGGILRREVIIVVTKGDNPPFRVIYVGDPYAVRSNE